MSLTREEVAAVTAVTIALEQQRAEAAAVCEPKSEQLHMWVEASRRSAQRALLQRGPWRLSGSLGRRSRT